MMSISKEADMLKKVPKVARIIGGGLADALELLVSDLVGTKRTKRRKAFTRTIGARTYQRQPRTPTVIIKIVQEKE